MFTTISTLDDLKEFKNQQVVLCLSMMLAESEEALANSFECCPLASSARPVPSTVEIVGKLSCNRAGGFSFLSHDKKSESYIIRLQDELIGQKMRLASEEESGRACPVKVMKRQ